MKRLIKKTASTALSILGIISMIPAALCAPGTEDETLENLNQVGHIDPFHIMIVGKYLNSIEDLKNLGMVNKKYRGVVEKYRLNPVEINSKEVLSFFPSMETCRVENFKLQSSNYILSEKGIKTLIYFPSSFNSYQFIFSLKSNGIIDANKNYTGKWERKIEINNENPMDGCKVTFTNGEKTLAFMFDPCCRGIISDKSLNEYNRFLSSCGVEEATVKCSGELYIPVSVKRIEAMTFSDCEDLTKVTIPNSVNKIEPETFWGCKNLKSITIPDSVMSIGEGAFVCCENLTSVNIPNSVKSIEGGAFWDCKKLKSITIPDSITRIEGCVFNGCSSLNNFNIPNSVMVIEERAFERCKGLTSISIPNSVMRIGECAFSGCESLTNVDIPKSVTIIKCRAFENCKGLTSISIPSSVMSIEESAFDGCENLKHIEFNDEVYDSVDSFMKAFKDYRLSERSFKIRR